MRRLAECGVCRRQYDASELEPGSRFHCDCAAVVVVPEPRGHDAAVVRCTSCGAPRREQSLHCLFCQSDFTLHERDLHTVCPHCLARTSDRAKFCHHCGTRLAAQRPAGRPSRYACPACPGPRPLASRQLGADNLAMLECGRCAGLWLGQEEFAILARQARSDTLPAWTRVRAIAAVAGSDLADPGPQRFYRPCVVCQRLMNRRQYARGSGVILDMCRDHGIWFDADELARLLAWLRQGVALPAARREPAAVSEPASPPAPVEEPQPLRAVLRFLAELVG
jgi:Zn-finger nucleic acid-binding protein